MKVFNRPVVRFRAALPGVPPAVRARRAQEESRPPCCRRAARASSASTPMARGTSSWSTASACSRCCRATSSDGQTIDGVVAALAAGREGAPRGDFPRLMLRATGFALLATLVFAGAAVVPVATARLWLGSVLAGLGAAPQQAPGPRRHGAARRASASSALARGVHGDRSTTGWCWSLAGEWLGFVLRRFPYTRRWGEELNDSRARVSPATARARSQSRCPGWPWRS